MMLRMLVAVRPCPADRSSSAGSIAWSLEAIESKPPMAASPTIGSTTRPTNISAPWKTSDQATARKPPLTL